MTLWQLSSRSIFIIVFVCCVLLAQSVDASASDSLAKNWQSIKNSLPHGKLPSNSSTLISSDIINSWAKNYGIGLVKVIGLGFVIAFLSVIIGIFYGIFKLLRACCRKLCCARDDEEYGKADEDDKNKKANFKKHGCPTLIYVICWVFLVTGMGFGLQNNPRFSTSVGETGDSIVGLANNTINFVEGILDAVVQFKYLVPTAVHEIEAEFAGVIPLAGSVETLSTNINSTTKQVGDITTEISAIDTGNTSAVQDLVSQLSSINAQSDSILTSMASLTGQVSDKLKETYDSTVSSIDGQIAEIDNGVDTITSQVSTVISKARDITKDVADYVSQGKKYDGYRAKGVTALFSFVIFVTFAIVFGYIFKKKFLFNIITAFCFVFLFLVWLSGSIHFLVGLLLGDACPILDPVVKGALPPSSNSNETSAGAVIQGCLFENVSIFESAHVYEKFNLTQAFAFENDFRNVSDFSKNFNFSQIDGYFDSIGSLYTYNLSAVADNMTVANFGWNQSYIYTALDGLNNLTSPTYYGLNNYTTADPTAYPSPKNTTVYEAKEDITNLLNLNQTIYNKTATAKKQLYKAQDDMNALILNMAGLKAEFGEIKDTIDTLQRDNITHCLQILDSLKANITAVFAMGSCSFLGQGYTDVKDAVCVDMQDSIDCLTAGQFLAGLALIPILIIAEVMSFRYPKTALNPVASFKKGISSFRKGGYNNGKGDYAIAMTDSPATRRPLTATLASSREVESPGGSPDFRSNRVAPHDRA